MNGAVPGDAALPASPAPAFEAAVDPLAQNALARRLLVGLLLATALALACLQVTDLDVGGHLTVGREILKTRTIPSTDFFTHTVRGAPYPVHQWLGEVVMFAVEHFAGATGLILLRMAIVLGGTIVLYRLLRAEGAPVVVACAILLLVLVAMRPRFFARPFLVAMLFLPLLMTWIADVRDGRTRRLWPILPLTAVWGHVHSGVVFAVLFLSAALAGEGVKILAARKAASRRLRGSRAGREPSRRPYDFFADPLDGWNYRRLAFFSAIAIALPYASMALVNPSGSKPLLLPFLFASNANLTSMIQEYRRVDVLVDWPWDLVAGACVLGCLVNRRRVDLTDLLVAGGFGLLAFVAVREILCFGVAAVPLLGRTWGGLAEDLFARLARRRGGGSGGAGGSAGANAGEPLRSRADAANGAERAVIALVAAACLAASGAAVRGWMFPFGFGKNPRTYPDRAIDFLLAQNVRGPIFNTDVWASSLLWRDHGKAYPVFVDARLEAYPPEFWRDTYYRVLQAVPGWEEVLDRHRVQFAMIRREGGQADDRIGEALWANPRWGVAYWDDYALIYIRRDSDFPRNREVLAAWEFTAFDPRHPDRVLDLGGAEVVRAEEELARLAEWNPESFLLGWTRAAAWTASGRGEEARAALDALSRRPEARGNAQFLASRAEAALVSGDRAAWKSLLEKAGRDPSSAVELHSAAALLARAGARSVAAAFYRDALAANPAMTDAMNNLALLLAEDPSGVEEALRLLDDAIARRPDDAYYLSSRGEVLLRAGRVDEARAELRRALEKLPAEDAAAREAIEALLLPGTSPGE